MRKHGVLAAETTRPMIQRDRKGRGPRQDRPGQCWLIKSVVACPPLGRHITRKRQHAVFPWRLRTRGFLTRGDREGEREIDI